MVVTFNYRLGPFGFLAGMDDNRYGNFGLYDQQNALKWIHNEIEHFGGNKNKVTIFGFSAGSRSVGAHMVLKTSHPYFTNGYAISGDVSSDLMFDERSEETLSEILKQVQCYSVSNRINCLRETSVAQLNLAYQVFPRYESNLDLSIIKRLENKYGGWQWGIVEDKNLEKCNFVSSSEGCYVEHRKKPFVAGCWKGLKRFQVSEYSIRLKTAL